MTKFYFKQLFVTVLLLCSTVASAQTIINVIGVGNRIMADGLFYEITSDSTLTLSQPCKQIGTLWIKNENGYNIDIAMPETITCKGVTYTVTGISQNALSKSSGISISIPASITTIEEGAFNECDSLKVEINWENVGKWFAYNTSIQEVVLSNNVKTIEREAFVYCTELRSLTISNSVTTIEYCAFASCTSLTSVTIGNNVTTIGNSAFAGCKELTSITIPNSVTSIEKQAFVNCAGLTSIVVASENPVYDSRDNCNAIIETATNTLFAGCKNTTIPNSVTTIGNYAFTGCTGLTSITIPNSATTIGNDAFLGCTGLTNIVVASGNTVYDSRNNCNAIIETATNTLIVGCKNTIIPNSVTTIGSRAFCGCSELTNIDIPNSVTTIEYGAFLNCSELTDVTIPNSVTTIGSSAFYDCTSLKNITIPNSHTNIEYMAFHCTAWYNNQPDGVVYAGNVLYEYKGAMPENTNIAIKEGTSVIAANAFLYKSELTSIDIPNSVTTIGSRAFCGCSELTNIDIPNSVTTIENGAFLYCSELTDVTIPNSVTTIGSNAFFGCTGLTSIVVASDNTVYDSRNNCNAIIETETNTLVVGCNNTTIPNDITTIGSSAFYGCTGLTSITIPNSATTIGSSAFYGCTGLTSITIGNSITSISQYAFGNCENLVDVYCLATTVPSTSSYVFDYPNCKTATLHVPATAIESYRATAPWSNFGTIVAIEGSEEDGDEPSITTGEAIDLGLPSGIKWASCNIGATAPEEYGGYYAWGETEEKDSYDWSTYKWCNGTKYSMTKYCTNSNYGTVDNKTTLDPEDDVAHVKWGGNWRMPTLTEQQELIDNCVWVWTTINDVIGYNVTGPNGNSIFLPAAGFRSQKATKTQGSAAHYWTGSLNDDNSSAFTFYFYNKGHRCISNYRDRGHTVRPVYDDGSSTSIEIITPEVNNENTIYDLRGQKLTEITAPGIYIVNGKKVIVK